MKPAIIISIFILTSVLALPMELFMTFNTFRNNIKPVFFSIAFMVMVLASLRSTLAFQSFYRRQFSRFNCHSDSRASFAFQGKFQSLLCGLFSLELSSLFALVISLSISSTFLTAFVIVPVCLNLGNLIVFLNASFALISGIQLAAIKSLVRSVAINATRLMFVFRFTASMKAGYILNFLAHNAFLCYCTLRHGFFLVKKLCLEPTAAHTVAGSLYYSTSLGGIK